MQTRRDQLQAYRFVTRRIASALTAGDPDSPELPFRRLAGAVFGSVMIAALAVAGVGIYGALNPGGASSWRTPGTLVVEQETNTRYVYLDGVLHPVLNYASARLILKNDPIQVTSVSRSSLAGVPHGLPVGIPGAPDTLPDKGLQAAVPWSVCSEPVLTESGAPGSSVRVRVGTVLPGTQPVTSDSGLLVQGGDRTKYLVWQGKRFRLAGREGSAALGYGTAEPMSVRDAWLNALPAGSDMAAAEVPNRGAAGPMVGAASTRVGQVLQSTGVGGATQYYLVRADGVQAITHVDAALLLGSPASQAAYPGGSVAAVSVSAADVAAAPDSRAASVTHTDQPTAAPPLADPPAETTALCATYTDTSGTSVAMTVSLRTERAVSTRVAGGSVADHVDVPPGGGAVVRELPDPGVPNGATYLVTDLGYKFPVAGTEALNSLGYKGIVATPIPTALLQLVSTGPALDPAAATAVVPVNK